MPALVTEIDGEALMAFNQDRGHPWHRLGNPVEGDMGIKHALKVSGSDDVVYPATVYTLNDDGSYEEVEGFMAAKSDKYGTLGIHRPGYNIKQRSEILELGYDLAGLDPEGAHVDTVGNLGEDGKPTMFFSYVRVPDLVIDPNGIHDTIERGLFVATSFDASLANVIGYSHIRVVCFNTLSMAMKGGQVIRAKHTVNADERLHQAAFAMGWAVEVEKQTVARAEKMLAVQGDRPINKLLDHFYPVKDDMSEAGKTRRSNERAEIMRLYNGPRNAGGFGKNAYSAYNAFVEYRDHFAGVKVKNKGYTAPSVQRATRAVLPGKWTDDKVKASELVLAVE